MDGGYDDGYRECPCFWGSAPGSLVAEVLQHSEVRGKRVLDLGCGEGKNAAALARAGASVIAVDCSQLAIRNGKAAFPSLPVEWVVGDAVNVRFDSKAHDLVIMYGLPHCLPTPVAIRNLISVAIKATRVGGTNILVAFNDGSHELQRAHPGFCPTLIPHAEYLKMYATHEVVMASNSMLHETHPHNGVPHHHSLTRLVARILP